MGESGGWRVTHVSQHATYKPTREGHLPEKDMSLTARGSSVAGFLASGG